jgi:hypothetical protein
MKSEVREFFNKEIDKIKSEMVRLPINERADILSKIHPIILTGPQLPEITGY